MPGHKRDNNAKIRVEPVGALFCIFFSLGPEMTKPGNTFSFNRNFLPFARSDRSVGIPTQYTRVNNGREMNKRGGRPLTFYRTYFLIVQKYIIASSDDILYAHECLFILHELNPQIGSGIKNR